VAKPNFVPVEPLVLPLGSDTRTMFLTLTSRLCPAWMYDGQTYEQALYGPLLEQRGFQLDHYGNYWCSVGPSRTIFSAHLDTAADVETGPREVVHREKRGYVATDGRSILGADDKAGVCVVLAMVEAKVPGLYVLFADEEVGCLGSRWLAWDMGDDVLSLFDRMIVFDRAGSHEVLNHLSGIKSCSSEFARELCAKLTRQGKTRYWPSRDGGMSDALSFVWFIPEVTNIGVGYEFAHTGREIQDLRHLDNLIERCLDIDWEALPTRRKIHQP
jgi:hypothetical protein